MPKVDTRNKYAKAQNPVKTMYRLLSFMDDSVVVIVVAVILVFVSTIAGVVASTLLTPLFNKAIIPFIGQPINPETLKPLITYLVYIGVCYGSMALANFGSARIMSVVCNHTINKIRNAIFSKMQKLPLSFFDSHTHGELMAYYTSDVGTVRDAISSGITELIGSAASIIGFFIMMVIYSWQMTLAVIGMMLIMMLVTTFFGKKSINNYKEQQSSIAGLNGFMEEMMAGSKVVKVFTHEDKTKEDFDIINERARVASTRANIYSGILGPIMNNLSHINYAVCSILGAFFCIKGSMDVGKLASFLTYAKNFANPVSRIMQRFNSLMSAVAGAERIFAVLDLEDEVDAGDVSLVYATYDEDNKLMETSERTGLWAWKVPNENGFDLIRLRGDVRFIDVDFSYDGKKQVLNDVSFYAKPGQKIAFVGATGAGKTTITNLINRFYDITDGQILYDGIDIKRIKKDSLRSSLAFVLQDTHLFTGTVKDNIRYGRLEATDQEIIAAAKLANADEFITMLPQGYDTILTEDGVNLSQGQRQLLNIARAACADAPVLVLDEATSSIDTRTEMLIEEGMDNLMMGRTVFVIAHRLSTVRNSNAIMVLDHGVIIERGDHQELLDQKGQYYSLYTGQFELD